MAEDTVHQPPTLPEAYRSRIDLVAVANSLRARVDVQLASVVPELVRKNVPDDATLWQEAGHGIPADIESTDRLIRYNKALLATVKKLLYKLEAASIQIESQIAATYADEQAQLSNPFDQRQQENLERQFSSTRTKSKIYQIFASLEAKVKSSELQTTYAIRTHIANEVIGFLNSQ